VDAVAAYPDAQDVPVDVMDAGQQLSAAVVGIEAFVNDHRILPMKEV